MGYFRDFLRSPAERGIVVDIVRNMPEHRSGSAGAFCTGPMGPALALWGLQPPLNDILRHYRTLRVKLQIVKAVKCL
mgnify:FL=1